MRQFRSDDTSTWGIRYGNKSNGAKTFSSSASIGSADGYLAGTISGSAGSLTGSTSLSNATYNQPCVLHQSRGTGASSSPNWEFNYLLSVSGGTATFLYPLDLTYTIDANSSAQIVLGYQFSSVTINPSVTLTVPAWNGSTGGLGVLFCGDSFTCNSSGSLSSQACGFRQPAGPSAHNSAQVGEGYLGIGGVNTSANGDGGGGGASVSDGSAAGAGGGYATSGATGNSFAGATGGAGGGTVGNASLQTLLFGGAGGRAGATSSANNVTATGHGGGAWIVLARTLTFQGNYIANGGNGANASTSNQAGSGGGAGGAFLGKGQVVDMGSTSTATGGAGGIHADSNPDGGAGGVGRFHIDYAKSITGTTNPVFDTRQDSSLFDTSAAFMNAFL